MPHRSLAALAALVLATAVCAEEPVPALEDLADAPPPPEPVQSGEPLEPDVTIVQKDDRTVEEYRVNGKLYMIKITPKIGKPYYLLDSDGDGKLESRMSEIYSDFVVPKWVLFSW